jgi:hypothetical protein
MCAKQAGCSTLTKAAAAAWQTNVVVLPQNVKHASSINFVPFIDYLKPKPEACTLAALWPGALYAQLPSLLDAAELLLVCLCSYSLL